MDAVREFCDRVILIEDNRLVAEGGAAEVTARYEALFDAEPEAFD
jgi:ABC-type multidrug transport system ATPase subunit